MIIEYTFNDNQFYGSHPNTLFLAPTLTNLHRVKHLHLYGAASRKSFEFLTTALSLQSAPLLEQLSFDFGSIAGLDRHWTVPLRIFCSETPRLRRLKIFGPVNFSWDAHILRGLTHLHLEAWSDEGQPASLEQLSTLLRGCPDLIELKLDQHGLSGPGQTSGSSQPRISLKSLRTLDLTGSLEGCCRVASLVSYPSSACVTILAEVRANDDRLPEDTLVRLPPFRHPGCKTLALASPYLMSPCSVLASDDVVVGSYNFYNYNFSTVFEFKFKDPGGPDIGCCCTLPLLHQMIDLATIQHLILDCACEESPHISVQQWDTFLHSFPAVEMVTVSAEFAGLFIQALLLEDEQNSSLEAGVDGPYPSLILKLASLPNVDTGTFLPALRNIEILHWTMRGEDFQKLTLWAHKRKTSCIPLKGIVLESCDLPGVSLRMCHALKQEVEVFEWPTGSRYPDL